MREALPECAGFAEVDPPYAIGLLEARKASEGAVAIHRDSYTEIDSIAYPAFIEEAATEVYRLMRMHSFGVWWFGPTHYSTVLHILRKVGFEVSEIPAIWDKGGQGQTMQPDTHLANCYEMFFVIRKGKPVLRKPGRSNLFRFPPVVANRKIHPTERPIDLVEELLLTFASPGQTVLCPFLGSGNTLRAAYTMKMKGFGWDLRQNIKDQFLLRIKEDSESGEE